MQKNSLLMLDGVRVSATLAVMLLHTCKSVGILEHNNYNGDPYRIVRENWLLRIIQTAGLPAVDVFFVLTGFFAAYSLIPAFEKVGREQYLRTVARYYFKRLQRIIPVFYSAVGLMYLFLLRDPVGIVQGSSAEAEVLVERWFSKKNCPSGLLHDLFFIGNYHPPKCISSTWSLDVQMQFYALFPIFLLALSPAKPGFHKRLVMTLSGVICANAVWRGLVAWSIYPTAMTRFPSYENHALAIKQHKQYIHILYQPSHMRVAPLAAGVILALIMLCDKKQKQVLNWLQRNSLLAQLFEFSSYAILVASVVLSGVWHEYETFSWSRSRFVFQVVMLTFGPGVSLALFYVFLTALLKTNSRGILLSQFMSLNLWKPFAEVSYSAYLLHNSIKIWMFAQVLPPGFVSFNKPVNLFLFLLTFSVLSFALAWVHHNLVEACKKIAHSHMKGSRLAKELVKTKAS